MIAAGINAADRAGGLDQTRRWGRWFALFLVVHVVFWTVVPGLTQPNAPLDVVEIICWGHEWQLGYFKHPPLPSWLGELARQAGGEHGDWAVYLAAQLAVVTGFWSVWRLGLKILSPAGAFLGALLLEASQFCTGRTLEYNHSIVVLPFFGLATLSLYEAIETGRTRWWLALGLALGLGALSKYIIAFLGMAMVFFLIANQRARRTLRTAGPYVALAVATLVVLPHLIWVVQHQFDTVAYARERGRGSGTLVGRLLSPFLFLGFQAVLQAGIFLAALPVIGWLPRLRTISPGERFKRDFLYAMTLGPGMLFALMPVVTGMRLRTAWGTPLWLGTGLLLLVVLETKLQPARIRRAIQLCVLIGLGHALIVTGTAVLVPAVRGKSLRIHFPGRQLARQMEQLWNDKFQRPLELVGGERWLAGNVGYYGRRRPTIFTTYTLARDLDYAAVSSRACPWTSVEDFNRRGGILLWYIDLEGATVPAGLRADFPGAQVQPPVELLWQTRAQLPPVRIGVAIVPPGSPGRDRETVRGRP